jgi:hypothetical protein
MNRENLKKLIDVYRSWPADTPIRWDGADCLGAVIIQQGWSEGEWPHTAIRKFLEVDEVVGNAIFYASDYPSTTNGSLRNFPDNERLPVIISSLEKFMEADGKRLKWRKP